MKLDSHPSLIHKITHENNHHNSFLPNRASSLSCHFSFDPTQDHVADDEIKNSGLKFSIWNKEDERRQSNNPTKWMKNADHDCIDQKLHPSSSTSRETELSSNTNKNSPIIRVCSECNTTKTPLWRSGPKGPKSLCNACGIKQRKARHAMAASAAAAINGKLGTIGLKKRCKMAGTATCADRQKQLGFEDFLLSLSKNLAFNYRGFAEEEKDAAILLMALSSGLING